MPVARRSGGFTPPSLQHATAGWRRITPCVSKKVQGREHTQGNPPPTTWKASARAAMITSRMALLAMRQPANGAALGSRCASRPSTLSVHEQAVFCDTEKTRPCATGILPVLEHGRTAMAHCRAVREPPLQHALLPLPVTTPVASAPALLNQEGALFPARPPWLRRVARERRGGWVRWMKVEATIEKRELVTVAWTADFALRVLTVSHHCQSERTRTSRLLRYGKVVDPKRDGPRYSFDAV